MNKKKGKINNTTTLANKIQKQQDKSKFAKFKNLLKRHKFILITLILLLLAFSSWEVYAVHSYRTERRNATALQYKGDYNEAHKTLESLDKLSKRSLIIFFTRKNNIQDMIYWNERYIQAYKIEKDNFEKTPDNINEEIYEEEKVERDNHVNTFDINSKRQPEFNDEDKRAETQKDTINIVKPEPIYDLESEENNLTDDWTEYYNKNKPPEREYLCTTEEIQEMGKKQESILKEIYNIETQNISQKYSCIKEKQEERALCEKNACRGVGENSFWQCIEQLCSQYSTQICEDYFNSKTNPYNQLIESLQTEFSILQNQKDICYADRNY